MMVFKQKSFNSSKTQELSKTPTQNYTNQSHNTCTRRTVYWELVYIRDFQSQHYTLHIHATATSYKYITHNYTAFSHLITFYISPPPLSPLFLAHVLIVITSFRRCREWRTSWRWSLFVFFSLFGLLLPLLLSGLGLYEYSLSLTLRLWETLET